MYTNFSILFGNGALNLSSTDNDELINSGWKKSCLASNRIKHHFIVAWDISQGCTVTFFNKLQGTQRIEEEPFIFSGQHWRTSSCISIAINSYLIQTKLLIWKAISSVGSRESSTCRHCKNKSHVTLQTARWQPVHSNNLQTTPTEDISRNFTTTNTRSSSIYQTAVNTFFNSKHHQSQFRHVAARSSSIYQTAVNIFFNSKHHQSQFRHVDMDESITSRSAFYWGHDSIQHFQQNHQQLKLEYTVRLHQKTRQQKRTRRDDKEQLKTYLITTDRLQTFWFLAPNNGGGVYKEARAKNCNHE